MQKIELFSSPVWKTKLDPTTYNKQEILDIVEYNYNLQPTRDSDLESSTHNYYSDWNNPKFKKINLDILGNQYKKIIHTFIESWAFNKPITYRYEIVNIHASRSNQYFKPHDHATAFYSTIHYLSLSKDHRLTEFHNPLIIGQYDSTLSHTKPLLANVLENSNYFWRYKIDAVEDDFIFFPSYLKHEVLETKKTNKLRVAISTNIYIEEK